jgi:hypothetical protein
MDSVDDERQHAGLLGRGADEPRAWDLREHASRRLLEQRVLVRRNGREIQAREIVHGGAEADDARDVRGAGFELVGQGVVRAALEAHGQDHVAAALVRRHLLEQRALAVQDARPRRAEHLVARERVEVAVERFHVDAQMRHGLSSVDERDGAHGVSFRDQSLDGIHGAERVRDVRKRGDLCPCAEQRVEGADVERAVVANRRHDEARARALAEQLPRDDVRVMLEARDQHLVARRKALAEARRDEVDRFRRAAREDDLGKRRRVDEASDFLARALVGGRRPFTELMHAAMDVRVVQALLLRHGLVHRYRRLARRCVIEVRERLPMHELVQRGEVPA